MEPVRPAVDAWVLDLLENRVFRRSDFFETREGMCRIMPPLTKLLAEIAPKLATVSLSAMMRASGLSRPYRAMIRRGTRVPHPRHRGALRTLAS